MLHKRHQVLRNPLPPRLPRRRWARSNWMCVALRHQPNVHLLAFLGRQHGHGALNQPWFCIEGRHKFRMRSATGLYALSYFLPGELGIHGHHGVFAREAGGYPCPSKHVCLTIASIGFAVSGEALGRLLGPLYMYSYVSKRFPSISRTGFRGRSPEILQSPLNPSQWPP
jgi:hypothetical protein